MNAFSNTEVYYELEKLHEDAQLMFHELGSTVEVETYTNIHRYLRKMFADIDLSCRFKLSIDDLSVRTQNFYEAFSKLIDTHRTYAGNSLSIFTTYEKKNTIITIETMSIGLRAEQKEKLLDYVEKFSMTALHHLLFCPLFTKDEEMDLIIQKRLIVEMIMHRIYVGCFLITFVCSRIRQLNWVNATHLDCHVDEMNPMVRDLAFNAMLGKRNYRRTCFRL